MRIETVPAQRRKEAETVDPGAIAQASLDGGPEMTAHLLGPATFTACGRTGDNELGRFAARMDFNLAGSIGGTAAAFRSRADEPTLGGRYCADGYYYVFPEISGKRQPHRSGSFADRAGRPHACKRYRNRRSSLCRVLASPAMSGETRPSRTCAMHEIGLPDKRDASCLTSPRCGYREERIYSTADSILLR